MLVEHGEAVEAELVLGADEVHRGPELNGGRLGDRVDCESIRDAEGKGLGGRGRGRGRGVGGVAAHVDSLWKGSTALAGERGREIIGRTKRR